MELRARFPTPCFNQFCWDLINTVICVFLPFYGNSNSKALGSGTSDYAVCIYVSNIINPISSQQLKEMV
jgi:hypothetical protein